MKTVLQISLFANLVLAGTIVYLVSRNSATPPAPAPVVAQRVEHKIFRKTKPDSQAITQSEWNNFRWSQIESSDYRTYVANLRAIGCPEQTIHDIITADVASLCARHTSQSPTPTDPTPRTADMTQPSLDQPSRRGPQQLSVEEQKVVAEILGAGTTSQSLSYHNQAPTGALIASGGRQTVTESSTVPVPLVLQPLDPAVPNVDPTALNVDSRQCQAISDLQQNFVDAVGGQNQNPNDPAYLKRWVRTVPESDDMLRGLLGIKYYLAYEFQADNSKAPK